MVICHWAPVEAVPLWERKRARVSAVAGGVETLMKIGLDLSKLTVSRPIFIRCCEV